MFSQVVDTVLYYVWHEKFWFPRNLTWDVMKNTDNGIYHPQAHDMLVPLVLAFVFFVVRILFERHIAAPAGLALGVPPPKTYRQHVDHPALWRLYRLNRNPNDSLIQGVAKQADLSRRQVEQWFRIENCRNCPSKLQKFSESSWRFTFYFSIFSFGTYVLWDKPWYTDTLECWYGYPHHHVTRDIYWYMMLELAYYWAALFTQFRDIRRKDAVVMSIHHMSTLILMVTGYINAHVRSCTIIVYIHDAVDFWMEAAKMAKYSRRELLCNVLFCIFLVMWFVTRLCILPVKILYHTLLHAHQIVGHYPFYWVYNGLMLVLQCLHVIWFVMICRIAYRALTAGSVQGDVRSETDESINSEDDVDVDSHLNNGLKHKTEDNHS